MLAEVSFAGFPFPFPAAVAPSPIPLASLLLWLDAVQGVALDGGSTRVTGWASRVGGASAVQGTPAAMPTLAAAALNGLPGVRLDGADDYLEVALPTGSGTLGTAYLVASGLDGTSPYRTLLSSAGGWRLQTNDLEIAGAGGFGFMLPAGAHIVTVMLGDGTRPTTIAIDGVGVGGTAPAPSGPPATLDLGRNVASGGPDYGYMTFHEVLYYAAALSSADDGRVRAYLAAKWGLA